MSVTDPIADMLTCIRNASRARHEEVRIPASETKEAIVRLLHQEGYIRGYQRVSEGPQGYLRIVLKYTEDRRPAITGLERASKPGRRVYVGKGQIPRVLGGLGVAIVSTPRGVLTDTEARKAAVGGEVLCRVW